MGKELLEKNKQIQKDESQKNFVLSDKGLVQIQKELKRYEQKYSATIPCLYILQRENEGWISNQMIQYLSVLMDIPESKINEVFFFYTMFNKKPVGKYHIQVCTNITCSMLGARELTKHILKKLNVSLKEMTPDRRFSVSQVECLGHCEMAPVMQINEKYHGKITQKSVLEILGTLD